MTAKSIEARIQKASTVKTACMELLKTTADSAASAPNFGAAGCTAYDSVGGGVLPRVKPTVAMTGGIRSTMHRRTRVILATLGCLCVLTLIGFLFWLYAELGPIRIDGKSFALHDHHFHYRYENGEQHDFGVVGVVRERGRVLYRVEQKHPWGMTVTFWEVCDTFAAEYFTPGSRRPYRFLKYPIEVGSEWRVQLFRSPQDEADGNATEVIHRADNVEIIETSVGTFETIRIVFDPADPSYGNPQAGVLWLADIGIIKYRVFRDGKPVAAVLSGYERVNVEQGRPGAD